MADREKPLICLPMALDEIVCGNAQPGYYADHLARHDAAGVVWRTDGNSNVWAAGRFAGGSSTIDFVALLLTNADASTKARLRLGNGFDDAASGGEGDSTASLIRSPTPSVERRDGLSHWFFAFDAPVTATHWHLEITDHTGDFQASALVIGSKVVPSRFYNLDYSRGMRDLGDFKIGRWGVPEDTGGQTQRTIEFALGWIDEAEFEDSFLPMMERLRDANGNLVPLYCCFDPAASSYRQSRTYFGYLGKPLVARGIRKPKTYTQEFSIVSLI